MISLPQKTNASESFFNALTEPSQERRHALLQASLACFESCGIEPPTVKSSQASGVLLEAIHSKSAAHLRLLLDAVGVSLSDKAWMNLVETSADQARIVGEFACWELASKDPALFGSGTNRIRIATVIKRAAHPDTAARVRHVTTDSNLPHLVASRGNLASLRLLFNMGFSLDISNQLGPPCVWAAQNNHVEGLIALESLGALSMDHSVVHAASNALALEAVVHLLSRGAAAHSDQADPDSALHHLAVTAFNESGPQPFAEAHSLALQITRALLAAGADPNARNSAGATPLMIAAWASSTDMVYALLEAGAHVTLQDDHGHSALDWCAKNAERPQMAALIQSVIDRGALENLVTKKITSIVKVKKL